MLLVKKYIGGMGTEADKCPDCQKMDLVPTSLQGHPHLRGLSVSESLCTRGKREAEG